MILTVTTTMISRNTNANMWFLFEPEYLFNSFGELNEIFANDGSIVGERIETEKRGNRTVEVGRTPLIITQAGVVTLAPVLPHLNFEAA